MTNDQHQAQMSSLHCRLDERKIARNHDASGRVLSLMERMEIMFSRDGANEEEILAATHDISLKDFIPTGVGLRIKNGLLDLSVSNERGDILSLSKFNLGSNVDFSGGWSAGNLRAVSSWVSPGGDIEARCPKCYRIGHAGVECPKDA